MFRLLWKPANLPSEYTARQFFLFVYLFVSSQFTFKMGGGGKQPKLVLTGKKPSEL